MSVSTIRKAIGVMKDQTSIRLAKMSSNVAPNLEILVVKSTSHDNEPADEKYVKEILNMMLSSKAYIYASIFSISMRLSKTRDWIVALKALVLVHNLLNDGGLVFGKELLLANRRGKVLDMSEFRDEAHSGSWDHSGFVRSYALYLAQKVEFIMCERKLGVGDEEKLERLNQLIRLLDFLLGSKPMGEVQDARMIGVTLCLLVKESFKVYGDVQELLKYFLDHFCEFEYGVCVEVFDAYVGAMKIIEELDAFYNWCKDVGLVEVFIFPKVVRISDEVLRSLEKILREKREKREWAKFPVNEPSSNSNGWEMVLVESDSNFGNQKSELGGGFDAYMLNRMYDHATSVALPRTLALPSTGDDPFAASLLVPPPTYVQLADMEKKEHLVRQEKQIWEQYANSGTQAYGVPHQGYYYTFY